MSEASVSYLGHAPSLAMLSVCDDGGEIAHGTVVVTMYGGVMMFRGYCRDCRMNAFIENGRLSCCGDSYEASRIVQARIATKPDRRSGNSPAERDELMRKQGGLCFYCARPFWSEVFRRGRSVVLRPETDHFVPFSYCQDENGSNKVAACHVCNALKNATVFLDSDTAREYIAIQWRKKGYFDAAA